MSKIITITGNLLREWTFSLPATSKKTVRTTKESFQLGGKGINVAKMLQRLGHETTAVAFAEPHDVAIPAGQEPDRHVPIRSFALGQAVRQGFVIREDGHSEKTYLGVDKPVPLASWEKACAWILDKKPEAVAFCGSFPGWTTAHFDIWKSTHDQLLKSGGLCFLDTYGPTLNDLMKLTWSWIHLNKDEWSTISAQDQNQLLTTNGLLLSNGAESLVLYHPEKKGGEEFHPPKVEEVSPTGCGDVLLATWIDGCFQNIPMKANLHRAMRYASLNAADPGVADFPLPE